MFNSILKAQVIVRPMFHDKINFSLSLILDGFAFSQEEGGVITQSEVITLYDSNKPKPEGN